MNERALIKSCQKGEKQAFEELIRLFYPYVSKFLLKTTADGSLAEDLTQDTFLKMVKNIDKYDLGGCAGFGTWLIAIAKNCYIDHLRRNRIYVEPIENLQLSSNQDLMTNVLTKLQYEEVLQEMKKIPEEQRIAIRLKYEEDLTLAEIAAQFGIPAKTIKSRIHDGKVKLRRYLKSNERMDCL